MAKKNKDDNRRSIPKCTRILVGTRYHCFHTKNEQKRDIANMYSLRKTFVEGWTVAIGHNLGLEAGLSDVILTNLSLETKYSNAAKIYNSI